MAWSPSTYLAFADERTRPARDLLARVPLTQAARVVDLGCGPGNSTGPLVERFPGARVVGVDPDPAMLERARASGVAARFVEGDAAAWAAAGAAGGDGDGDGDGGPPDLVFSNAALQWVGDHDALLPRLLGRVRPGGVLAVQMPRNFDAPSHTLLRDVAADGPWADDLAPLARPSPVHPPERYVDLLAPGAAALDVWETTYLHRLAGDDPVLAWTRGTALVPYLARLRHAHQAPFLAAYGSHLRAAYPRRPDGTTLFPFRRLFMVAVRAVAP